jgi:hypothetical protein
MLHVYDLVRPRSVASKHTKIVLTMVLTVVLYKVACEPSERARLPPWECARIIKHPASPLCFQCQHNNVRMVSPSLARARLPPWECARIIKHPACPLCFQCQHNNVRMVSPSLARARLPPWECARIIEHPACPLCFQCQHNNVRCRHH